MKKKWRKFFSFICCVSLSVTLSFPVLAQDIIENGEYETTDSAEKMEVEDSSLMDADNSKQDDIENNKEPIIDGEASDAVEEDTNIPSSDMELYNADTISITYSVCAINSGWQSDVSSGQTAGVPGKTTKLNAFSGKLTGISGEELSIQYKTHVSNIGWQSWKANGEIAGASSSSNSIEAMQIQLTGTLKDSYNIYYRVYSSKIGWMDYAKNGEVSGTTGMSCPVEAIEIIIQDVDEVAPGRTGNSYLTSLWDVSYQQIDESTTINIAPKALPQIMNTKVATTVSITATMTYGGSNTRNICIEKNLTDISINGFQLDLKTYGKFNIKAEFKNNGNIVGSVSNSVGIIASEYNIAPVSATSPVTLFSLSLWDITKKEDGSEIPTIVMLTRPSAYDWSALPDGVYGMPYLTEVAIQNSCSFEAYIAYMRDLCAISPNSIFHLYINDIDIDLIQQLIYANKLSKERYTLTLLTDGSATYNFFNETYNNGSDPVKTHQKLLNEWNNAKAYAYKNGVAQSGWSWHKHMTSFYAVVTGEENVDWWVIRTNLFKSSDKDNEFANEAASKATKKNIANMLTELQNKGEDTVNQFKALYKFNDEYFQKAAENGKQAMMILGTYVFYENVFEDYAHLTELYYGDDYVYYYKGHPNTPTGMYPTKQEQLNKLDIIDVDSSIAAELILFFNPEICLSGYGTSTFNSASDDMACGLYNTTKSSALSGDSGVDYSGIDWFASSISKDSAYISLCKNGHTYYLVEFSDSILATADYDFALYDATSNVLIYYKKSDKSFKVIRTSTNGRNLAYSAHVSNIGWQNEVYDGKTAGTVGQSKALEGLKLNILKEEYNGNIEYQAHVANVGWQEWKKNGELAGTTGKSFAIEAMKIKLTGELVEKYDIYYRVHVQNFGWLDWTKNGQMAGTAGYGYRVEAIEIRLVNKGGNAPGKTENSKYVRNVAYQAHVQNIGDTGIGYDGDLVGTVGKTLRMEAIKVSLPSIMNGSVEYKAHVQNIGWQGWRESGKLAGTKGKSLRMEAVKIRLTGEAAKGYDIYYQVHVQNIGWLDWAKNGEPAGSEGYGYQMEAIRIKLVEKGGEAPGKTNVIFKKK